MSKLQREPEPDRDRRELSVMGAQAVRLQLDDICNVRWLD